MEVYVKYLFYYIISNRYLMWLLPQVLFVFFSFVTFYQFFLYTEIPLYKLINITGEFIYTFYILSFLVLFFFILWLWSFITLFILDPGSISQELKKMKQPKRNCANTCQKCDQIKPNRTHHCSRCNICYSRMDHHCILFGKCIALRNQKIFVLSAFYSLILSFLWFFLQSIYCYLYKNNITKDMKITFLTTICDIAIFFYQFYKPFKNIICGRTYLEVQFNIEPINPNNTALDNIKEVFGEFSWKWFFPIVSNQSYSIYSWESKSNENQAFQ